MGGDHDVRLHFIELGRVDVGQGVFLTDDQAGHQRGGQFRELDRGRNGAHALEHRQPQLQGNAADLLALDVIRRMDGEVGRKLARTAIEAADDPQARLVDEFRVEFLKHFRGSRLGRQNGVRGVVVDVRRVEHRYIGKDLAQGCEIVMGDIDRAHLGSVDHFGNVAEL